MEFATAAKEDGREARGNLDRGVVTLDLNVGLPLETQREGDRKSRFGQGHGWECWEF